MGEIKSETLTLILVNLAGIMEKADESLLPGVYKEVGQALNTDPTGLGSLTLFRSIVQACCYPLAAYLASTHNRAHVIALGALLWSAATFLVAFSSTFAQVAVSRGLNGIGLAIVTPAIQSLVADSTDETNRGTAFGWLHFTANMGSILGGLCSVLIASTSFMGIPGWRVAFHLVGLVSIIVGILVGLFAKDPHFSPNNNTRQTPQRSFWLEFKDLLKESKSVIKLPSFQIIVAQGVAGSFPWSALSFAPMWLELIGFSHKTVALLGTLFGISTAVGGLFGGMIGDKLSQRLPNSGRILLAQISSGSGIPLAAVLLLILPDDPSTAFNHGLIMVIMGLMISWCGPATNNPIFAEIVPEKSRTNIYALDRSFESILSSFAPPIVGILAQHAFGYVPVKKGLTGSEEIETDRENAVSLAKALYSAIGIPFTICCLVYSLLYWTYPRDRERARMVALIDSEMERLESFGAGGDEREEEERSVIDMSYDVEECIELDENDEKRLLAKGVKSSGLGK